LADLKPAAVLRPLDPQQVAQHPQQPDVVLAVDADLLAVDDEGVGGHRAPQNVFCNPSVGDCGIGGTVGSGVKPRGRLWLMGKLVGSFPVARAYAHATAAIDAATPNSPAPPGSFVVGGITITWTSNGTFHSRV